MYINLRVKTYNAAARVVTYRQADIHKTSTVTILCMCAYGKT